MFYKVGKKTTKVSETKFREYVEKENLTGTIIYNGLVVFKDNNGNIKAKIDKTQEE